MEGAHTGAPVAVLLQRTKNIQGNTVALLQKIQKQQVPLTTVQFREKSPIISKLQTVAGVQEGGRKENGMTQRRVASQREREMPPYTHEEAETGQCTPQ